MWPYSQHGTAWAKKSSETVGSWSELLSPYISSGKVHSCSALSTKEQAPWPTRSGSPKLFCNIHLLLLTLPNKPNVPAANTDLRLPGWWFSCKMCTEALTAGLYQVSLYKGCVDSNKITKLQNEVSRSSSKPCAWSKTFFFSLNFSLFSLLCAVTASRSLSTKWACSRWQNPSSLIFLSSVLSKCTNTSCTS